MDSAASCFAAALRFSLERFPGFGGQKLCFVLYKLDILYSFLI